ncbi:hypothetical protein T4E_4731 [Trichinella pseudospiralis]|uniref:Uncharacterized protein n=1 Tax=Trichinella pseudospiralis TaxID=6337 RepID=A0A0V0YPJ4_TRIPS|nr:hypothetical protein T4E_4731 [Trichinella pseudospiralis]
MDVRRCSFLPIASDKVRAQSSSPTHADTIHPNCQLTNTLQFSQANTIIAVTGQGDFPISRPVAPDIAESILTSNSVLQKLLSFKLAKWEIGEEIFAMILKLQRQRLERAMELRLGLISCGLGGPILFSIKVTGLQLGGVAQF